MEDKVTSCSQGKENGANESLDDTNFWDYLYQLQKTGVLCDLQMCVKDEDDFVAFPVHKIVLSGSSRFFSSCLQNDSLCDYYHFDGITAEQLQIVIDYVYRQIRWDELIGHPLGQVLIDTLQVINHDQHETYEQNQQVFSENVNPDSNVKSKKKTSGSRRVFLCADELKNAIDDARSLIPKKLPGKQVNKLHDNNGRTNRPNLQQPGHMNKTLVKEYHDGKIFIVKEQTTLSDSAKQRTTIEDSVHSNDFKVQKEKDNIGDRFKEINSGVSRDNIDHTQTSDKELLKDSNAQNRGEELKEVLDCKTKLIQSQLVKSETFDGEKKNVDSSSSAKPMAKYFSCFQSIDKIEHKVNTTNTPRLVIRKQRTASKEHKHDKTLVIHNKDNVPETEAKVKREKDTSTQIDMPFIISKNKNIVENTDNRIQSHYSKTPVIAAFPPAVVYQSFSDINDVNNHENSDTSFEVNESIDDITDLDAGDVCDTNQETQETHSGDVEQSEGNFDANNSIENDNDNVQQSILECEHCKEQFQGDEALQLLHQHMKTSHSEEILPTSYSCSRCSYHSSKIDDIRSHERKIHKLDVSYTCEYCSNQFQAKKLFYRHLVKEHNCQPYDCHICGAKFTSYEGMKHHLDTNHKISNRPHICEICGKDFKLKQQLKNHINITHKETADIPCQLCDKKFKQFSTLSRHLKTFHSDVRDFPCHICQKAFKTSDDRNKHVRRHFCPNKRIDEHGNKVQKHPPGLDYKCSFCGKIFKNVTQMRAHERKIHIEKQEGVSYLCTICSKMFDTRHYLNMHISNTHRTKTIECPDCLRMFNFKYELRRHKVKCKGYPTGPKPFKCDTCQKAFTMKGNLTKHQQLGRCKMEKNNQPIIPVDGDFVVVVQEGDPLRKVDIPFDQIQQLDSNQIQSADQNISHLIQPAELVVYNSRQLENMDSSQLNCEEQQQQQQQTIIYNNSTSSGTAVPIHTTNTASSHINDVMNTEIIDSLTQTVVDGSGFSVVGGVESSVIVADNELIIYEGH